ncbi:putative gustatory receptor 28b [Cotesia typhae]|uniref:putative gustatory receptor 28b n=1 Tax=Cotesia typhae TaxID=2053667 RepID=UPI003D6988F0
MFTASITTIKKQTSHLVKNITALRDRSITDDKIVEKLSQFSIDLLHLKVEFTTYDIMPLDRTLLAVITGTITMYLIIAIQFADSPSSDKTKL